MERTHGGAGGTRRLVELLRRYGNAIEADLAQEYGEDLSALFTARRWRRLLVLIDGLPSTSRFVEAVAQDDEAAAQRAEIRRAFNLPDPERSTRPRLVEFGPTERLLAEVVDRLGEVVAAVIASGGGKPPKLTPRPRPETAEDRLASRFRLAQHERVVGLFLPPDTEE